MEQQPPHLEPPPRSYSDTDLQEFTVNALALQSDNDWFEVDRPKKKSAWQKFKDLLRSFFAMVFSSVGICVLVIGYLFIGAFAFNALELEEEMKTRYDVTSFRNATVKRLWDITERFNTLHHHNWSLAVQKEILAFQHRIVEETGNGYAGTDIPVFSWTFSGSLLYSITVITTIGYGHISPSTLGGKIFTMIYALIGMPLFLLYLSNIGHIMATSFKWSYSKLCTFRQNRRRKRSSYYTSRATSRRVSEVDDDNWYMNGEEEMVETDLNEYDECDPMMLEVISEGTEANSPINGDPGSLDEADLSESRDKSPENQLALIERDEDNMEDADSLFDLEPVGGERLHLKEIEYIPEVDDDEESDEPKERLEAVTVPITLSLTIMVSYICGGAVLFGEWEGWGFLDGSYFCFITLSTIGFGDIVPGDSLGSEDDAEGGALINVQFIFCSMYIILGMAVIAMCFNLMQEKVVQGVTSLGKKLGIIGD